MNHKRKECLAAEAEVLVPHYQDLISRLMLASVVQLPLVLVDRPVPGPQHQTDQRGQ